jgi:uncharacterized membrane protein YtjA (UPF0391 family)
MLKFKRTTKENTMFGWAIIFLLVAIAAGIFGFTGIASQAAGFARIVFFIAVIVLVLSLIFGRKK